MAKWALNLKDASTGDPVQTEKTPPHKLTGGANVIEANDRRTIRQAIMTQLMREVADEIVASGTSLKDGSLAASYRKGELPRLQALITDPEPEFNKIRDRLYVSADFGSINLVVFRNAMAILEVVREDVEIEEVAKRVVVRAGRSGFYSELGFAGCK